MSELQIGNLCFTRNTTVILKNISLTAPPHSLVKVVGHNGSGKTTLLKILGGVLPATSGSIRWNGAAVDDDKDSYVESLIYIGHQNALSPHLTALENLQSRALLRRRAPQHSLAQSLIDCGLNGKLNVPCRQLSAGQRRRVALAALRAFVGEIWLLDEPFASLDTPAKQLFKNWITEHVAAGGIVITTMHNDQDLPLTATQSVYCQKDGGN